MAGVIAGQDEECLGFAPDTEIYAFRVFTDAQVMDFYLLTIQFCNGVLLYILTISLEEKPIYSNHHVCR